MDSARAAGAAPEQHNSTTPASESSTHMVQNGIQMPIASGTPEVITTSPLSPAAEDIYPPRVSTADKPAPALSMVNGSLAGPSATVNGSLAGPSTPPQPPRPRREARVPASPLGRVVGFAGLGASLLYGTVKGQVGSMLR